MFSPTSIFHFHFSLQLPAEDIDDRVRAIFKVHDGDGVMIFNVSKQHTSYTCTSYIIHHHLKHPANRMPYVSVFLCVRLRVWLGISFDFDFGN